MFKMFKKTPEVEPIMEYETDVFLNDYQQSEQIMEYQDVLLNGYQQPEQITELTPQWEEVFERMDAIEAKIDLLLDNQNF